MNILTSESISTDWPAGVIRVSNCLVNSHVVILCVDSDYYDWTYEERVYVF
jgi:hypothetical protein